MKQLKRLSRLSLILLWFVISGAGSGSWAQQILTQDGEPLFRSLTEEGKWFTSYELKSINMLLAELQQKRRYIKEVSAQFDFMQAQLLKKDSLIGKKDLQFNEVRSLVEEVRPEWWNNFLTGAVAAILVITGWVLFFI